MFRVESRTGGGRGGIGEGVNLKESIIMRSSTLLNGSAE